MCGAVDHHAATAAEADLQLHLLAVRVLPDASARRDALEAQGETVEAGAPGEERGIGVAAGGHRLPVGRPLARLDDDRAASNRFLWAHRPPKRTQDRPPAVARIQPRITASARKRPRPRRARE